LLDGQRDVDALADELDRFSAQIDRAQAAQRVAEYVRQFASHALLLA